MRSIDRGNVGSVARPSNGMAANHGHIVVAEWLGCHIKMANKRTIINHFSVLLFVFFYCVFNCVVLCLCILK